MPAQTLIESLQKLLEHHASLNEIAQQKTEALKKNDGNELNALLRKEQKLISAIESEEQRRKLAAAKLGDESDSPTITEIAAMLSTAEKERLLDLQSRLVKEVKQLKEANDLNQQLLHYSLQFINLTIDLLAPEPELSNYSRTNDQEPQGSGRSLFDSKA